MIVVRGLDGKTDAALGLVDLDNARLNVLTNLERIFNLFHPIFADLRNVHEAVNVILQLNKRPEIGDLCDRSSDKIADLESHLSGSGATVDGRDMWGKRRFAYEIEHLSEGYYSVVTFQAEAAAVDSLDRMLSLADEVVRHKIVRRGA